MGALGGVWRTCGLLLSHLCGNGLLVALHLGTGHGVTSFLDVYVSSAIV